MSVDEKKQFTQVNRATRQLEGETSISTGHISSGGLHIMTCGVPYQVQFYLLFSKIIDAIVTFLYSMWFVYDNNTVRHRCNT